jgi:hypothetical protein
MQLCKCYISREILGNIKYANVYVNVIYLKCGKKWERENVYVNVTSQDVLGSKCANVLGEC